MSSLTITQQPSQELQPAYTPLVYLFRVYGPSGSTTSVSAAALAQVFINGVAYGSPIPLSPYEVIPGASYTHFFELNISDKVQEFFDMADFLPSVAAPTPAVGSNLQAEVYVVFSHYYPDSDGILQLNGTAQSSIPFMAINGWRRADEDKSLQYYDLFDSPAVPSQARFLTRKPARVVVGSQDTEFLGLYAKGFSAMRVRTYDAGGALLEEGQIFIGVSTYGSEEVVILPVGPANINAIPSGDWINGTGPVSIDSDVRYYIIQAGLGLADGSFWTLSELRRYFVVPDYCQKHRIHFINSFGCPDAFSIWNSEQFEIDVDGETYERALPDNPGIIDPGTLTIQNSGRLSISSPVGNLTREDQEFLAREFAMSPRVWIQQGATYLPARVDSGNFDIADTGESSQELTFSLLYSRREFSQRN